VKKTNAAFMSGVPELLLLKLLMHREMYGYELVKAIQASTQSQIDLAEGVIYPALHSLEQKGLLKSRKVRTEGRTRVYYRTTAKGITRLDQLNSEWERVSSGINAVLSRLMPNWTELDRDARSSHA